MGVPAGPWHIDDTLTFTAVTHKVDTGVLTDADSVPSYRIYEDETGTAILNGSMAKLDDANTTGFYSEQITLSAANGFENGKSYSIYISATVNSIVGGQTFNFKVDVAVSAALDGRFDALDAAVADVPTNAELATALAAADDAVLAQIALVKAQTDGLTFTVAGQVDTNLQYVNDVQVTGNGQAGTEWGP